jgi:hypothetical protein
MEDKVYPFRVKYKGYVMTQTDDGVVITKNKQEVLNIHTARKMTEQELIDLFEFVEIYIHT